MINAVSDRIRNILKTQDQTPQSRIIRSRDNSIDSQNSNSHRKTRQTANNNQYTNNAHTNTQTNLLPNNHNKNSYGSHQLSHPPRSPSKHNTNSNFNNRSQHNEKQSSDKSNSYSVNYNMSKKNTNYSNNKNSQEDGYLKIKHQHNDSYHKDSADNVQHQRKIQLREKKSLHNQNNVKINIQADSLHNENQLIQKIKNNIMDSVYTLFVEMNKKIQQISSRVGILQKTVSTSLTKSNELQKQVRVLCGKVNNIQNQELNLLDLQLARLKDQHNFILRNLSKNIATIDLTKEPQIVQSSSSILHSPMRKQNQKIKSRKSIPIFRYQDLPNPIALPEAHKCKCQSLIQQILQSQNHMMMELKYIKHFQNNVNGAQKHKHDQRGDLLKSTNNLFEQNKNRIAKGKSTEKQYQNGPNYLNFYQQFLNNQNLSSYTTKNSNWVHSRSNNIK